MTAAANVFHFLSDPTQNEFYGGRVQKYLQPESVHVSAYADNAEAFREMTGSGKVNWSILIVDAKRLTEDRAAIAEFRNKHPACKIVSFESSAAAADDGVIRISAPGDIDAWLEVMNGLI